MKARLPYSDSGRGWIVTGAMSTPTIAVDTNSRPDGSSRNATGEEVTSQAARQTAGRASRLPDSALVTRPSAASPRACSRRVSDIRCRSRVELSRSSSEDSTRASTANSCSSASLKRAGVRESAARLPTRVPSDSSSGTPR